MNKDRYGRCFVFPLLMKQILPWSPVNLSWSPVNYTVDEHGELQELPHTCGENRGAVHNERCANVNNSMN